MSPSWNLLSFMLAIVFAPQPAPTFPPHGGAFVTTLPAGASTWLDGTYIGQTPFYVDDLVPGRHSVTLSRSGWQPESDAFDVFIGRVTPVSIVMRRAVPASGVPPPIFKGQGILSVRGGPPGSKVYVDGNVVGILPVDPRTVQAGYHIVTIEPPGKNPVKSTRIADVFPDGTTAVEFVAPASNGPPPNSADDILEPVDSVVPSTNVVVAGNDVTIHYRGVEVECAIGSRAYKLNGKAATLGVPPAIVGGKVYLPTSLLRRLAGK